MRRAPYESQADSVMYRQVLAELAARRGWIIHRYDAGSIETDVARVLDRAQAVIHCPRHTLGPPWTKDHRIALAVTIVASAMPTG